MFPESFKSFVKRECVELVDWMKCGDSTLSTVPTLVWAMGAAALSHRLLTLLFRRFMFRRVPAWEILLQHLLFVWMVVYSVHMWLVVVKITKSVIAMCFELDYELRGDIQGRKLFEQWMVWFMGFLPLTVYVQTRPRQEQTPVMIWITTSPWQRREMGPYGYYLHRPLSSVTNLTVQAEAERMRKALSDTKLMKKETVKRRRYSKSI